jgi:antitoxin StbD
MAKASCLVRRPLQSAFLRTSFGALFLSKGTRMTHRILTETTASISQLKRNPMGTVAAGDGLPVAVLNHNKPAFYCVPAKAYEALMDRLDDLELNLIADARLRDGQAPIKVALDEL